MICVLGCSSSSSFLSTNGPPISLLAPNANPPKASGATMTIGLNPSSSFAPFDSRGLAIFGVGAFFGFSAFFSFGAFSTFFFSSFGLGIKLNPPPWSFLTDGTPLFTNAFAFSEFPPVLVIWSYADVSKSMFRVNAGFVESDVEGASKLAAPPGGASSSAVVGVVKALPPPDTPLISSSKANAGGGENEGATHNAPTVTTFTTTSFCNTAASRVFPPLSEEEEEEESKESDKAPTISDDEDDDEDENVDTFFFFFTTKAVLFEEKASE